MEVSREKMNEQDSDHRQDGDRYTFEFHENKGSKKITEISLNLYFGFIEISEQIFH